MTQVRIIRDSQNRIMKYCLGGHWLPATPDYFPLVKLNYAPYCCECAAKRLAKVERRKQLVNR